MKMDQTSECQYQFGSEQLQDITNHYLIITELKSYRGGN